MRIKRLIYIVKHLIDKSIYIYICVYICIISMWVSMHVCIYMSRSMCMLIMKQHRHKVIWFFLFKNACNWQVPLYPGAQNISKHPFLKLTIAQWIKNVDFKKKKKNADFRAHFCPLLDIGPWASYLVPLCFGFSSVKWRTFPTSSFGCCKDDVC